MFAVLSCAVSELGACAFTWTVTCALPDLKVMELGPDFLAVRVQVPSPLSVTVDTPADEFSAVMLPVAPFGRAVTVIFTGSLTLQVMLDGVAMSWLMLFVDGVMVPVDSS